MATDTVVQIQRQDPDIEKYRKGLLEDVNKFIKGRIGTGFPTDALGYKVAGLTPGELNAIKAAQAGIGAYLPYLQGGESQIRGGQLALDQAGQLAMAQRAVPYTYQNAAAQTVSGIGAFNPYVENVVNQSMRDIDRARQIQGNQLAAQQVNAGAFGGSRGAIAQQELNRNAMEQMARTSGQLRQQGYEQAMGRRAQEAQLLGQLGIQYGQLGQADINQVIELAKARGALGVQQAGMAELGSQLSQSQIQQALAAGAMERGQSQAALDAARMTNQMIQNYPYQQYGFLSDIYSGVPTSQSTMTMSSSPQVNPFQTAIGMGISGLSAAAGAKEAGLF